MATEPLIRFSRGERWVHRTTAVLFGVCVVTAAILYNATLANAVGSRNVVADVHLWSGFALPVPMLLGLLSGSYRADLRRLDRFTSADWKWLRSKSRRSGEIAVGKFNAGQKLNAALSSGAIIVLLLTGVTMWLTGLAPLAWRTGATFVHDWGALCLGLLIAGHIVEALRDPEARRGMRSGRVSVGWARRHHAAWADEVSPRDRSQT